MIIKENIGETFIPSMLETPKEMTKRYMDCLERNKLIGMPNRRVPIRESLYNTLPKHMSQDEQSNYILNVMKKWKRGDDMFCGNMWAYFNLMKIHVRAGGGEIQPTFRQYDNKTFDLYNSCIYGESKMYGNNSGKGVVAVGKRGEGKSAKIGALALSVASCNKSVTVMLTSKSEATAQDSLLTEKVKFAYYRLPNYVKHNAFLNNRGELYLGNGGGTGIDSKILVKAPVPEALEGFGARLVVHDEAGKTPKLLQLLENSLPILNGEDGFTRVGFPLVIGVAGDFDKFGSDYIDLWNNANAYDFLRWFIPGYAGMHLDKYGEEDIEQGVEQIFTKRIELFRLSESAGAGDMQRFPLTPEECFQSAMVGILPKKKIVFQQNQLLNNPVPIKSGEMLWLTEGEAALFSPSYMGKVKILEHPIPSLDKFQYISFIDAYDIQEKRGSGSKGAIIVFKRLVKLTSFEQEKLVGELETEKDFYKRLEVRLKFGFLPVAMYVDDIDDPRKFGENAIRLSVYYKAMCLVEKMPSQIFVFLKDNPNYYKWLQWKPVKPDVRALKKEHFVEKGMKIDEMWKSHRTSALQSYFEDNYESIFFLEILADGLDYDPEIQGKKKDIIDALGGVLLHDKQPFLTAKSKQQEEVKSTIYGYVRGDNGRINTTR